MPNFYVIVGHEQIHARTEVVACLVLRMRSLAIRTRLARPMKKLLSEELIEERMLEQYREDIDKGFELLADKPKFRRVAGRAYVALCGSWNLSRLQAVNLLGLTDKEYEKWLDEDHDGVGPEHLEKISCLLGTYRYLMTLYSGQRHRGERWLKSVSGAKPYAGNSPLDLLSGSDSSIFRLVRRDLAGKTV